MSVTIVLNKEFKLSLIGFPLRDARDAILTTIGLTKHVLWHEANEKVFIVTR